MRITVEHVGGDTQTYTIKPVTVVAFERNFNVGLGSLPTNPRMEFVYWLAWDSEKRVGKVVKPFDGWLEDVVDIELDEGEAAPLAPPTADS